MQGTTVQTRPDRGNKIVLYIQIVILCCLSSKGLIKVLRKCALCVVRPLKDRVDVPIPRINCLAFFGIDVTADGKICGMCRKAPTNY